MALNRDEKIKFINDLVDSVKASIVANVGRMPETWDGHELRKYIAERFETQTITLGPVRLREYRNDVLIHNL